MLNPLVILDNGPVAANNITNLPDNWKVLHPLGETSNETELGLGVGGLHTAMQGLVDHFDSTNEPILSFEKLTPALAEKNIVINKPLFGIGLEYKLKQTKVFTKDEWACIQLIKAK